MEAGKSQSLGPQIKHTIVFLKRHRAAMTGTLFPGSSHEQERERERESISHQIKVLPHACKTRMYVVLSVAAKTANKSRLTALLSLAITTSCNKPCLFQKRDGESFMGYFWFFSPILGQTSQASSGKGRVSRLSTADWPTHPCSSTGRKTSSKKKNQSGERRYKKIVKGSTRNVRYFCTLCFGLPGLHVGFHSHRLRRTSFSCFRLRFARA